MNKLLGKASAKVDSVPLARFEKYNLIENPFPSQAILNKDSSEKKSNGSIYEPEIRTVEYAKMIQNFIEVPQSDLSHQRLGFLLDGSYIGRGNGKTAFLLNLIKNINTNYCLDLSKNANKCFAIYFQPEGGGKTKTFESFVDILFRRLIDIDIIRDSLAILRLIAIIKLTGTEEIISQLGDEQEIIDKLNSNDWFRNEAKNFFSFNKKDITAEIFKDSNLAGLSADFPLLKDANLVLSQLIVQGDFEAYYNTLKKGKARFDFVFSDLVKLFIAAGFNGSYIFVDDFERIPDHLSSIQKKDFVTQLRTVTYDGIYLNSRIGFYNFIFALHAGVPRILQEAWGESGLEHRVSLNPAIENPKHMILFDKLTENHAILLIEKYLSEYRISVPQEDNKLLPFTREAIRLIGLKSEMNAAKILQFAYNIIEHAANDCADVIDDKYVERLSKQSNSRLDIDPTADSISKTETIDLVSKAHE